MTRYPMIERLGLRPFDVSTTCTYSGQMVVSAEKLENVLKDGLEVTGCHSDGHHHGFTTRPTKSHPILGLLINLRPRSFKVKPEEIKKMREECYLRGMKEVGSLLSRIEAHGIEGVEG